MQPLYLLESGFLGRSQNTLTFENATVNRKFPIKAIDSIYLLGEVSLNTKLLNYLAKEQIPVFFFGYYGNFTGVFYPHKKNDVSGKVLVKQVEHYLDNTKRLIIAEEIIDGSLHNMRKTLMQYGLKREAERIKDFRETLYNVKDITHLLSTEANARKYYYQQLNLIIKDVAYHFSIRTKQPPMDYINCLISFGNSLLYNTTLSEIYKTKLEPLISFLHEPFDNRYSLQLDITEIFKPLIVDRVIFTLINKRIIDNSCFEKSEKGCYLNRKGREKFIREYDSKLQQSLDYPKLDRKVSYRYLLRLECYNLISHLIEDKRYKSFKIYW